MDDYTPSGPQEEAEREAAEAAAADAARLAEAADWKWLMRHEAGRRIVWDLLAEAGIFRTSFTGDNTTFFNEGKRQIGLSVLARVNQHCPERYLAMLNERKPNA
jgi:hypothetical protein